MSTFFIALLLVSAIAAYSVVAAIFLVEVDAITAACLGLAFMLGTYVVVVGVLAWANLLSILGAVVVTLLIGITGLSVLLHRGLYPAVQELGLPDLLPLLVMLGSLTLVVAQFGILGMGEDEGVYHTKAIADALGATGNLYEFEEFHDLDAVQQGEYLGFLKNLSGFYNAKYYPTFLPSQQHCLAEGYFHGLPAAGAVYALGYELFGLECLGAIDVLPYAAIGWLIYAYGKRRHWGKVRSTLLATTFWLSPLVIWVTKSTLTESLLTLFIAALAYVVDAVKESPDGAKYCMCLPIAGFCFYHVSAFMLMPLFTTLLVYRLYETRDSVYHKVHALCLAVFVLGFFMMLFTAPQYTYDNLSRLYVGPINQDTLWLVPLAYTVVAFSVSKLMTNMDTGFNLLGRPLLVSWIARATIVMCLLFWVHTVLLLASASGLSVAGIDSIMPSSEFYRDSGNWLLTLQYTPLYATCLFAGPLLLPLSIAASLIKTERYLKSENICIFISFIYLALLCNVFVRREIPFYYYYARYIEYVLPIAILLTGIALEAVDARLMASLSLAGIIAWVPSIDALTSHQDITEISASDLLDICEAVEPGSAVLFNTTPALQRAIVIDVRELAQADVYPVFEDIDRQLGDLLDKHQRTYLLDEATAESSGTLPEILTLQASREHNALHADASSIMPIPLERGDASNSRLQGSVDYSLSLYDAAEYYWGANYEAQMVTNANAVHEEKEFLITSDGLLYGPYLSMDEGLWQVTFYVDSDSHLDQPLTVTSLMGKNTLASFMLHEGVNHLNLALDSDAEDVEFVIRNDANDDFYVSGPYLQKIDKSGRP